MLCWSWSPGVELPAIPQEDIQVRYFLSFERFFQRISSRLSPPRAIILSTAALSLLLSANLSNGDSFQVVKGRPYPTFKVQLYCRWYNTLFLFNALPLQRPILTLRATVPSLPTELICISSFLKPIAAQMFFDNSRVILFSYTLILHYIPYVYSFTQLLTVYVWSGFGCEPLKRSILIPKGLIIREKELTYEISPIT